MREVSKTSDDAVEAACADEKEKFFDKYEAWNKKWNRKAGWWQQYDEKREE